VNSWKWLTGLTCEGTNMRYAAPSYRPPLDAHAQFPQQATLSSPRASGDDAIRPIPTEAQTGELSAA
jgi:hypothetical protein